MANTALPGWPAVVVVLWLTPALSPAAGRDHPLVGRYEGSHIEQYRTRAFDDYGVRRERLKPWGVGFVALAASNASEQGRAKNRRVELVRH